MVHRKFPLALAALAVAGAAFATPPPRGDGERRAPPHKLLVRAGRIYTGAAADVSAKDGAAKDATAGAPSAAARIAPSYAPGALLLVDGKVAEVGATIEAPGDAEVLDLGDAVVMPGIVNASTTLAGTSAWLQNTVWKDEAVAAHFDPADAFDLFADWSGPLLGGVTTVYLGCGPDRLISGQGAVAKLSSRDGKAQLLARQSQLEVNFGSVSRTPQKVDPPIPPSADHPIVPGERQLPTTRLGQLMGLREAFARAQKPAEGDLPTLALAEAIRARRTIRFAADETSDLLRAVQAARELGQPAVLCGAAEGALVADQLAAARYPVIVEIGLQLQSPPADRRIDADTPRLRPETPAELVKRGVKVALATPARRDPADVLLAGAVALRGGLTPEQAIAALTRVPAEILGVSARVGSLQPGRDGDFVVLSGEPFLRSSHVDAVYVEGRLAASPPAETTAAGAAAGTGTGIGAVHGGSVVIRAGTILTGLGEPIRGGAIAIKDGRIVGVGSDVAIPSGARVIDAGPDAVVTPGFLDCNSHLEFGEDRSNLSLDFDPTLVVADAGEDARMVARAGVTTALVQPWQAHQSGSRVMAVKTAGATRAARIVDPLAAVKHYWRGPFDPITTADRFRGELRRAKEYVDKWNKYLDDLKKWQEEQKKKTPEMIAAEKAKAAADAKKETDKPEVTQEKKVDPITGKWDVSISGGPLPTPQTGVMNLKLDNTMVRGTLGALFGNEEQPTPLSGRFTDKHLHLDVEIDIQVGKPAIEADLDADDHLTGKLVIGTAFSLDFSAKRTEKTFTEVTSVAKAKKKKGADGRPLPPDVVPELEPYRAVFAGKAPILLECDAAISLRHALRIFSEFKLEVVVMGGEELTRLPLEEWRPIVKGVVLPEAIEVTRGRTTVVPGAELSALGVPVGFQSNGGNAARGLALNAAYAVRRGMDPRAALRALTSDPAKFFHIDDQVGALEAGRQGDVLVFSGDPFELSTRLLRVFVAGDE
ncbi:MAG TPA: amidohydrolase family protein, partial [Planctomycetota bacterium]|nr:amidohydrolase family protein [Planctomycetota bacterium]